MAEIGIYWAEFAPANSEQMRIAQKMIDSHSLDALYIFDKFTCSNGSATAEERIHVLTEACACIQENVALFLATVCDYAELTNYLCKMDGNLHICVDMSALMPVQTDEWLKLSRCYNCTVVCTAKEQHFLEKENTCAECWNIEYNSATARRMALLQCGDKYFSPSVLRYIQQQHLFGVGNDHVSLSESELSVAVAPLYDAKRFLHAKGCQEMAVTLARHYGADVTAASRAGLLHDITKALSMTEQLRLCQKYGIMTECSSEDMAKILHGKTAAAVAREIFGETEEVCSAIAWHTTGRAGMTLLEKIIYMADYIEPNRSFDDVSQLRELAFQNLDAAVVRGIDMTIELLNRRNSPVNRDSVEAREYLTLGDMK